MSKYIDKTQLDKLQHSRMRVKCKSVPNFRNIIAHMVNGSLGKNEQMIQFRQMIHEKRYIKKLPKMKDTDCKRSDTKSLESTKQVQNFISIDNKQPAFINKRNNLNELNVHFRSIIDDVKVIELWSSSTKHSMGELRIATNSVFIINRKSDCSHRLLDQQRSGKKLSFETWKHKKTIVYRQILKKIEIEQQQKLLENVANTKWKKITQQTQIHKKQENKYQQKQKLHSNKNFETVKQTNLIMKSNRNENSEKQIIDEYILNTSRKQKKTTGKAEITSKHRKNKVISMGNFVERNIFYSWLNQLNCILRKKYSREYRHLVRSLHCQPFHYGNVTFSIR